MNPPKKAYLSLGTNMGDKLKNLQDTVHLLYQEVGDVLQISKVYETPAWGFFGEKFFNLCLTISTRFPAEEVLSKILHIEEELGRIRSDEKGYHDRKIDIDILFFENEKIETADLKIPHPFISQRRFVLQPLADIANTYIDPVSGLSVAKLLEQTSDTSEIKKVDAQITLPETIQPFRNYNYIAVEGNIGAGKTSFTNMVSQDFNAKLILERFKDNPFLPKFYEDQQRYAFPLEMSFLADRYQQLSDDLAQFDLFKDFVISDYDVFKSLIFAKITLQEDEYLLYYKLFNFMYNEMKKPDMYIYLYQNTERLLANIEKRGRDYEKTIKEDYLVKINKGYLSFIQSQQELNVRIIDISDFDFIANRKDYLKILQQI